MIPDELKRMKPMSGSERLGANRDSEYLGAEDIDPGSEPILTISALYNGYITLQRGKENKDVITFVEEHVPGIKNVRPLVCNATNRKTLKKLYKAVTADAPTGGSPARGCRGHVSIPAEPDKKTRSYTAASPKRPYLRFWPSPTTARRSLSLG